MHRSVSICLAFGFAMLLAFQFAPYAGATGLSALSQADLATGASFLVEVKKKKDGGGFFDEPSGDGRSLCINDPSKKQKETLYKKCANLSGNAKCFNTIAQCCCFYKPKPKSKS
jgi:hypothetical protein